jgi:enoyl-CoA hydratase
MCIRDRCGLVSRVLPIAELLPEALQVAQKMTELSSPILMMAKESVNRSFEVSLEEGIRFERRLFHSSFATEDQKEGMSAFVAKRKPTFKNR